MKPPTLQLDRGSRSSSSTPNLLYTIQQPGNPNAWERATLERTMSGPRLVLEMGCTVYRLEPTAFVLEGLTNTLRRVALGELPHATLGPFGATVLERINTAPRLAA